jgi:hypothetical protein
MSKKKFRFSTMLTLALVSAILCQFTISPQVFAQAVPSASPEATTSFFNTTFLQNVAVTVLAAILAFLSGYALAGVSRRKGSGKKLSYDLSIANGVVQVEKEVKERVQILYDGQSIENLYNVKFELENTGDTVVKSQEIRFAFPENAKILDFSFHPEPEPEMGVSKIEEKSGSKSHERKCRIGQIERGQKVGVQFAVTSKTDIQDVGIYPFNEDGDVEFSRGDIAKQSSDKEQVAKFLVYLIFYLVIPPIFDTLSPIILFSEIMAGLARLLILVNLFKLIVPFSEVIASLIMHMINLGSEKGQAIDIVGDGNTLISNVEGGGFTFNHSESKSNQPGVG